MQKSFLFWHFIQNFVWFKTIRFDEVNRFIKVFDGIICKVLFGSKKYDAIYNKKDILLAKIGIKYIIFHISYLYWFITSGRKSTLQNVIILIKPIINKDKNHYDCNIFLKM